MTFASDGEQLVSHLTVPEHLCGWDSIIHGGIVATIHDEMMSWTAIQLLHKMILTKSVTVDFSNRCSRDGNTGPRPHSPGNQCPRSHCGIRYLQ